MTIGCGWFAWSDVIESWPGGASRDRRGASVMQQTVGWKLQPLAADTFLFVCHLSQCPATMGLRRGLAKQDCTQFPVWFFPSLYFTGSCDSSTRAKARTHACCVARASHCGILAANACALTNERWQLKVFFGTVSRRVPVPAHCRLLASYPLGACQLPASYRPASGRLPASYRPRVRRIPCPPRPQSLYLFDSSELPASSI